MKKSNFLFFIFGILIINCLSILAIMAQMQTDILSPIGGEFFGTQVVALPNGNFVVTDPNYDAPGPIIDVGAVYLYNGATLALINTMTGTATNDFVGSNFVGRGITVLSSGDYVISSSSWNGNRGAVTLCSATIGCPTIISAANSLTGSTINNSVGGDGIFVLPNNHYVVRSSQWDSSGINNVGAVTLCNATANSCQNQQVSVLNSFIGSTTGDSVGVFEPSLLSNGNFVVPNLFWDNDVVSNAGAVTFCNVATFCIGTVSIMNSLVGTTTNEFTGNQGVYPLTNGNYVVANDLWDNGSTTDVGAATFCDGTKGCTATVSMTNSLVGTTTDDHISENQIAVLSNGNYVVRSGRWDNSGIVDAGAATFCNGTSGCTNTAVSTSNSLYGLTMNDSVGFSVIALRLNGNYVVGSSNWDNTAASETNVGASTLCNGTNGCIGPVSVGNSLIGQTQGDIAGGFAVALANGNYVVISGNWLNTSNFAGGAGAVTFCNGASGCIGEVTPSNSLVGSSSGDNVGLVSALTNGNYVVTAGSWNNNLITDVGAATFCSGTLGCTGPVSPANSLIGTVTGDKVGSFNFAIALAGGNYVVISNSWNNGGTINVGALTTCNGSSGCVGTVAPSNSLVGSTANDSIGATAFGQTIALPNGNFISHNGNWDNSGIVNAGAVSYGFGTGATIGAITVNNSVRGTTADGGSQLNFSFNAVNNQLVVGRPADNIVTVFTPASSTAASVTVGGRVLTANGRGIRNARISMTDSNGEIRTATTNSFGYYRFAEVSAGETYVFNVRTREFIFSSPTQIHSISEDTNDINFIAD